jgi:tetratricopeptide (TPR) repeat protein
VKDLFDEYIIVDTGSTDCTKEIAHSFGARVFDFVWVSDFAAARNAALARATGEFVFWLDADDRLEPPERERLREFLASLCEPAAYVFRCACDPDPKGGGATVVDHIRLFPNREDIKWHYRVHEQILPSLRQAGIEVRWTDITIRHTGYVDQQLRQRKLERDLRILEEDLAERPDDPFVLFNMGSIAIEREDGRSALHYLERSLQGSASTDSITRKLYALIARAHQMLGESEAALRVCAQGLAVDADDAELLFRQAVLRRNTGDRAGAEASWRRVLTLRRPEKFSSVDIGIYGHLTRRNLAVLAEERGDVATALRLLSEVLAECPGDREALAACDRLGRRFLTIPDPTLIDWLVPGSRRQALPMRGPGDFDPYMSVAEAWVRALSARVVVELGVRLGTSARALLAGVQATEGHLWGVDLVEQHGIADPRFTFVQADAGEVVDRWSAIDFLHIDTDPHTEEQTLRWFDLYAAKSRAIALHDTHHPDFGVGRAVRAFLEGTDWQVYEYWGNPSGWTVLTRPGEPFPSEEASP